MLEPLKTGATFIKEPAWMLPSMKPGRIYRTRNLPEHGGGKEIWRATEMGEIEHYLVTDVNIDLLGSSFDALASPSAKIQLVDGFWNGIYQLK